MKTWTSRLERAAKSTYPLKSSKSNPNKYQVCIYRWQCQLSRTWWIWVMTPRRKERPPSSRTMPSSKNRNPSSWRIQILLVIAFWKTWGLSHLTSRSLTPKMLSRFLNPIQSHRWRLPRPRSSSLRGGWTVKGFTLPITTDSIHEISSLSPRATLRSNRIWLGLILWSIKVWDQLLGRPRCSHLTVNNLRTVFWPSPPRRRLERSPLTRMLESLSMISAHLMISSSSKAIDPIISSLSTDLWNRFKHPILRLPFKGQPFLRILHLKCSTIISLTPSRQSRSSKEMVTEKLALDPTRTKSETSY